MNRCNPFTLANTENAKSAKVSQRMQRLIQKKGRKARCAYIETNKGVAKIQRSCLCGLISALGLSRSLRESLRTLRFLFFSEQKIAFRQCKPPPSLSPAAGQTRSLFSQQVFNIIPHSILNNNLYIPGILDVPERIAPYNHDVCKLANFDGTQIFLHTDGFC